MAMLWLRLGRHVAWLRLGRYVAWLRLGRHVAWLRLGRHVAWLRLGRHVAWLRLGRYVAWLRLGRYVAIGHHVGCSGLRNHKQATRASIQAMHGHLISVFTKWSPRWIPGQGWGYRGDIFLQADPQCINTKHTTEGSVLDN